MGSSQQKTNQKGYQAQRKDEKAIKSYSRHCARECSKEVIINHSVTFSIQKKRESKRLELIIISSTLQLIRAKLRLGQTRGCQNE
jgi:hypothetical protein